MKVIFFSLLTFDAVGGIQAHNKRFFKALELNNIEYLVISLYDKDPSIENVIGCDSNVFKFIYYQYKYRNFADIAIWGHVNLSPLLLLNKIISKSKNIMIAHGADVWSPELSLIKKYGLRLADRVFSVSNYTKEKLIKVHQVREKNIDILHNCIILKNDLKELENPYVADKFNILTILRLDASYTKLKSIINILNAMKKLDLGDICFTIIGKGKKADYIKREIDKRDLGNQVRMLGYVENIDKYLKYCDVFSLVSTTEGFGIAYLEAMAYKKPCLAAKNCGSSDVVIDGYNGYSVTIDDIDDLANKILDLKLNKERREEFGENGYKLLLEKFTFEKYVKNQNKLLENCIVSNRG